MKIMIVIVPFLRLTLMKIIKDFISLEILRKNKNKVIQIAMIQVKTFCGLIKIH